MTTIGTFFKEATGYRGLISTKAIQGCAQLIPDPTFGANAYLLLINDAPAGHAQTQGSLLVVQFFSGHAPAMGKARLIPRDGYFILLA